MPQWAGQLAAPDAGVSSSFPATPSAIGPRNPGSGRAKETRHTRLDFVTIRTKMGCTLYTERSLLWDYRRTNDRH